MFVSNTYLIYIYICAKDSNFDFNKKANEMIEVTVKGCGRQVRKGSQVNALGDGALLTSLEVTGSVEGAGTPGDFDDDGDVDGADFLLWQRGESTNGGSPEDLAAWEANFGTTGAGVASATAVPESASLVLLSLGGLMILLLRRRT